jgi:mannose-1-phosphate guanylyltransferase
MPSSSPYAVIMAGGAGTRFWPASRRARPKQLLPLAGDEPLIRQCAQRLVSLCGWERIYVSTGQHLVEPTLAVLPEVSRERLLVEPVGRNTAPCLGWAAAVIARRAPEAVVMALPSDPHIGDVAAFGAALERAVASARGGIITTVGIEPTHPETGYGYIEAGEPSALPGVRQVRRFVEKPDRARAVEFVASGRYFWNSGMFFFRACDMLDAIRQHLPALADGLAELDRAAERGREAEAVAKLFPTFPAVSIDHGVMEHMAELAVVPASFGWSDIGSWLAAAELAPVDEARNFAPAGSVLVNARNNHVVDLRRASATPAAGRHAEERAARVIALVGVSDLVVVETDDALLVLNRSEAQDVKRVVEELQRRGDGHLT